MDEFRHIVRVLGADLDGNKKIRDGLRNIKGIGFMFANAICRVGNFEDSKKIGDLSDSEIKKIEEIIKNPKKYGLKQWLLNRRKIYDSGDDVHLVTSDLKLEQEFDIKRLKKIRSYRGFRHAWGLPCRGQRTRSNFRHGKTVGVRKKGIMQAKKSAERSEK